MFKVVITHTLLNFVLVSLVFGLGIYLDSPQDYMDGAVVIGAILVSVVYTIPAVDKVLETKEKNNG